MKLGHITLRTAPLLAWVIDRMRLELRVPAAAEVAAVNVYRRWQMGIIGHNVCFGVAIALRVGDWTALVMEKNARAAIETIGGAWVEQGRTQNMGKLPMPQQDNMGKPPMLRKETHENEVDDGGGFSTCD